MCNPEAAALSPSLLPFWYSAISCVSVCFQSVPDTDRWVKRVWETNHNSVPSAVYHQLPGCMAVHHTPSENVTLFEMLSFCICPACNAELVGAQQLLK